MSSSISDKRYFTNKLKPLKTDKETLGQVLAKLREAIVIGIQLVEKHTRETSSSSTHKIYTGDGGIALMYMRLSIQASALELPRELATKLDARAVSHFPKIIGLPTAIRVSQTSPLDSNVGPALLVIMQELRGPGSSSTGVWNDAVGTFSNAVRLARTDDQAGGDDVLYGRAGLLWGMMNVLKLIEEGGVRNQVKKEQLLRLVNVEEIEDVVDKLVAAGRVGAETYIEGHEEEDEEPPLAWMWHSKWYLGAIHGIAGILTILLQCPRTTIEPHFDVIISTISYLTKLASHDGNLPSTLPVKHRPDPSVQICHGSPGLLLLLITFRSRFPTMYLPEWQTVESKASRVVWETGLVRKGLGLCHGVTGNAWPWLLLAHSTRSAKTTLSRALTFLVHATELPPVVQDPLLPYGIPDHPYSMFEGLAGAVCAWADACVIIKTFLDGDDDGEGDAMIAPVLGLPGMGGFGPMGII